jgi:N-acetylornithine carbamoyltransferase
MAVPSSAVEIAALAGMNVTIARPEGFDLPDDVMGRVRENAASVKVTDKMPEAFDGQHVVYAKSWGSIANYNQPLPASLREKWIVTQEKMARTDQGVFMHCLPVRRNLIVRDEVLDGPSSIVVDQAENRLHTAKAILLNLLQEKN